MPAILHSDSTRVVTKLTALKSHTVHGKLTVIKTELEIRLNNGSMGHKYTRPMAHEPADPSRLVLVRWPGCGYTARVCVVWTASLRSTSCASVTRRLTSFTHWVCASWQSVCEDSWPLRASVPSLCRPPRPPLSQRAPQPRSWTFPSNVVKTFDKKTRDQTLVTKTSRFETMVCIQWHCIIISNVQ